MANERKISGKAYQRLEFLGDGVVDLVISERLYHLFPDDDEGVLSKMWTRAVKTETMAQIARQLGLGADLVLSRGDEASGGRDRDSTLADALGGRDRRRARGRWTRSLRPARRAPLEGRTGQPALGPDEQNPKGELQEMLQVPPWGETPTYRITSADGPDHLRSFEAVVVWKGQDLASGSGRASRRLRSPRPARR